jgi:hypothetical protein
VAVLPLSARFACLACQVDWIDRTSACWSCGGPGVSYAHLVTQGSVSSWHLVNGFHWTPDLEGGDNE